MAGNNGVHRGPAKHRPFKAALERLLNEAGPNPKKLDEIALALTLKAMRGSVEAIREIADRLDGKVPQGIGGSDELGPIKHERIERDIIECPENTDCEGISPITLHS